MKGIERSSRNLKIDIDNFTVASSQRGIYIYREKERERESEQRGFNYYARSRPENDRHEISASCKNDDNRGRLIIRVCRQAANFVEKGR